MNKIKVNKKSRNDGPCPYNYQKENRQLLDDLDDGKSYKSLENSADKKAGERKFNFNSLDPNERIEMLKKEVQIQCKINQKIVFRLGEIFTLIQEACEDKGDSFKKWVEDDENCKYSYSHARNYINVYETCFCMQSVAMKVPVSILIEVSRTKFPDKLREYLFSEGALIDIKNRKLKEIKKKYKKGGFEAIKKDIKEIGKTHRIWCQIKSSEDHYENVLRTMKQTIDEMKRSKLLMLDGEISEDTRTAKAIHEHKLNALIDAYEQLKQSDVEGLEQAA